MSGQEKNRSAQYWQRGEELGILSKPVNQVLSDRWNRFVVDPVEYIEKHHCLEYTEPQADWVNGMPMGNGDLGVLAYGSPENTLFHFGKTDLWDYRHFEKANFPECSFKEFRRILETRDRDAFDELNKISCARPTHTGTLKSGGTFRIELFPNSKVGKFRQRLSFAKAQTVQRWMPNGLKSNGTTSEIKMTSFIHAAQNVFVCNVAPGKTGWHGPLRWSFYRYEDPDMNRPDCHIENDGFWIRQELPGGEYFIVMGASDSPDFKMVDCFDRVEGCGVPKADEVNFYITIVSSRDSADPLAKARENIDSASQAGFAVLQKTHQDWWADYWRRGYVCTPWTKLEYGWYYSLYIKAAICRAGRMTPGLQGNFIKENYPAWNADFHNNINMQILYWGQDTANRLEFAEPLYKLFTDVLPQCKKDTAEYFKMRGVRLPIAMGVDGVETCANPLLSIWPSAGGWLAQHFWWHYRYSGDRDFLKKYAYPFIRETVLFLVDYLQEDENGGLYMFPTLHMETMLNVQGAGRDSIWDLSFTIRAIQIAIAAAEELGVDEEECEQWKDVLSRIAEVSVGENDIWKEFSDKPGPWRMYNWVRLNPIFPCELTGEDAGPEHLQRQAAATTEDFLAHQGDEPRQSYVTFSGVIPAAAMARMGRGEDALRLGTAVVTNVSPSGFIASSDSYFVQIDSPPGFSVMLNEMLLQSYDGVIRLFPAVPDSDAPVRFHSLRAQGGFLISSERRENRTQYAVVQSLCGNKLVMRNPFTKNEPSTGVQVKIYKLDADTQLMTVAQQQKLRPYLDKIYMPDEPIEFPTEPGQIYLISKEIPYITNIHVEKL